MIATIIERAINGRLYIFLKHDVINKFHYFFKKDKLADKARFHIKDKIIDDIENIVCTLDVGRINRV